MWLSFCDRLMHGRNYRVHRHALSKIVGHGFSQISMDDASLIRAHPRKSVAECLIPKPVLHLDCDHARIHKMCAAEGVAVVEQVARIGEVQSCQAHRPLFAKSFSQRNIVGAVRGEMFGAVTVHEPRTVVVVERRPAAEGQIQIYSRAERIALIVIEEKVSILRWRKVSKATGHAPKTFSILMGICLVLLCVPF